jgi:hypothetical protein
VLRCDKSMPRIDLERRGFFKHPGGAEMDRNSINYQISRQTVGSAAGYADNNASRTNTT